MKMPKPEEPAEEKRPEPALKGEGLSPWILSLVNNPDQLAEALKKEYRPLIRKICLPIVGGSLEDLEEITDDIILKVVRHRRELKGVRNILGWLGAIARNTAYDHIRGVDKKMENQRFSIDSTREGGKVYEIQDGRRNPEEAASVEEEVRRALEAVELLAPLSRSVIVLRRLEELPFKEIAARLGLVENTVKSLDLRAMERMAIILGPGNANSLKVRKMSMGKDAKKKAR